jgi:hypothetical protein
MYGYLLGAALMVAAGIVELFLGVEAAQKQLGDIAKPLTAEDAEAAEARGEDVVTDDESDKYLKREVEMLERAVADRGELPRRELGRIVGCKYWGPGRFGRALKVAVREGRVGHPRRGFYGPA